MAEEDTKPQITEDDMDTLRVLLHTIRGISPVSTATAYVPVEDDARE